MRKILITAGLLLGSLFGGGLAATAEANSYSGFTQLNTSSWTPLPNTTPRFCNAFVCFPLFRWTGSLPGKDTLIRTIFCNNGSEAGRVRIPAGSGATYFVTQSSLPNGSCFKFEGRMPSSEGNMTSAHFYDWQF